MLKCPECGNACIFGCDAVCVVIYDQHEDSFIEQNDVTLDTDGMVTCDSCGYDAPYKHFYVED